MNDLKTLERKTANELASSLVYEPRAWSWRDAECDVLKGPNGISMSASYLTIYAPVVLRFGFWNKRRIRRALKRWKRDTGNHLAEKERRQALLLISRCLVELRAVA
jgi:hypothetical protein